mmetsp:Transcript_15648/g.20393  ORF Transcript_15648/g.20393 Transcript_15648/m.20393 type:complete len:347 (-) Transcript_15648:11-1051(-)
MSSNAEKKLEKRDGSTTTTTPGNKIYAPSSSELLAGAAALSFLLGLVIAINLLILVGAYYFPRIVVLGFLIPYTTYALFIGKQEQNDGAPWDAFRRNNVLFTAARRYLNLKLVWDKELPVADKKEGVQFIFAVFPHGSNSDFRILMDGMLHDEMPNTFHRLRSLAASVLFRIPAIREISLWSNCVDASRSVAERLLKRGRSLMILPGGQAEQMRTIFGRERIYLNRRKGFIRLAINHNVPIIPVYVFGCSDYYKTSNFALNFRLSLLKNTGIAIPLAFGWGGHLLCPRPVDTTVVLGAPLRFKFEDGLSEVERVDAAHGQFCDAIRALFDKHKGPLGYGERELEII